MKRVQINLTIIVFFILVSLSVNAKNKGKSFNDLADVDAASAQYLPRNYVYTMYEAISTRTKLEKLVITNPESLSVRWALTRYYLSASNFIGGCSAKALEQSRLMWSTDNYIGCLAYEFVYNRLKNTQMAEVWYKRSIRAAQERDKEDFEWKEIAYNKSTQGDVKVIGSFNNYTPNQLYENNDATYSRKIATTPKNRGTNYKLIVDDKITIERP
ncbi:MAG: hypothetical protein H7101_05060 [Deinococcales bacterium]|nr:hypothetical protein [Chitinophagaceae bacterium]